MQNVHRLIRHAVDVRHIAVSFSLNVISPGLIESGLPAARFGLVLPQSFLEPCSTRFMTIMSIHALRVMYCLG